MEGFSVKAADQGRAVDLFTMNRFTTKATSGSLKRSPTKCAEASRRSRSVDSKEASRRSRSMDLKEARRSREESSIGSGEVAGRMKIVGLQEAGWTGYWEEGLVQHRPTKDAVAAAKRKEGSSTKSKKAAAAEEDSTTKSKAAVSESEGEKRVAEVTAGTGGEEGGLTRLSDRLVDYILSWTPRPIEDPDEYYARMTNNPLSRECFSQVYIDRKTAILRDLAEISRETSARFEKFQVWARAEYERKGCVEVDDVYIYNWLTFEEEEEDSDDGTLSEVLEGFKVVDDEEDSGGCNAPEILVTC